MKAGKPGHHYDEATHQWLDTPPPAEAPDAPTPPPAQPEE